MSAAPLNEMARGLVGAPFRFRGRDPHTGLDCVGLITAAMRAAGHDPIAPEGYSLRNLRIDHLLWLVDANELTRRQGAPLCGDIVLFALGTSQYHLAIVDGEQFIHAHAGLGRIVTGPCDPAWRMAAAWHLPASTKD